MKNLLEQGGILRSLRVVMVVEQDVRILGFFAQVNNNGHPFFDLIL
jgi:hypothetical protein